MTQERETPAPGSDRDGLDSTVLPGEAAPSKTSTPPLVLEPCAHTMAEHINAVVGMYADRDGLIELAWDYLGKPKCARLFQPHEADAMCELAMKESRAGNNCYIGPALRRSDAPRAERTLDADVIASRLVWADFDEEGTFDDALGVLTEIGAEPNWITETGMYPFQRAHVFWALTDDAPLADLRALHAAIAKRFNSDPTVQNPGRVMKMAGSLAHPRKAGRVLEATRALQGRTREAHYNFTDLRALLTSDKWASAALSSAANKVRNAPNGKRHNTLFKEAAAIGEIVAGGRIREADASGVLASAAGAAGLEDDEIKITIKDAFKRGTKNPRGPKHGETGQDVEDIATSPEPLIAPASPGEPWPLDALGDVLADAAKTIRDAVQCPDGLAGPSVLTAATLAVQGHYDTLHPLGHPVPCSLTLVTLGDSGERKSTADKMALQAFYAAAADGEKTYRGEYVEWRAIMDGRDAKRSHIKSKKENDSRSAEDIAAALASLGPDPYPPLPPTRIVTDPNFEGMIKWMATAHGSVAWISNEAGASVGGTAFADENRLKFGAGLSLLWDGQPIERVRAGDGHHTLLGRRFNSHLMLQGDIARPFLSDPVLRAQGWLSRALICEPVSKIGFRPWREPGSVKAALAPYNARLRVLIDKKSPVADKDGPPNVLEPVPIPWDGEARTLWIDFHDVVEASLRFDGMLAEHRGFGAKVAENAARIATVLAAFSGAKAVAASHMSQAIVIADHYVDETLRHREAGSVAADITLADKLRVWLMRWPNPTVCVRDIQRLGPNPVRDLKVAKRCAAILREYGWLVGPERGPWEIRGRA